MQNQSIKSPDWIETQKKAFTRWCNISLSPKGITITNLDEDFRNGTALLHLVATLSNRKPFPKFTAAPQTKFQSLENLNISFEILKEDRVKLINIGSTDIWEGNQKLTLGLIWALIQNYQLMKLLKETGDSDRGTTAAASLKILIKKRLNLESNYTFNFSSDFNSGILLSGIVNSIIPGSISDWKEKDPTNAIENNRVAMDLAETHLKVPKILEPEEIISPTIDEKTVITYISAVMAAAHTATNIQAEVPSTREGLKYYLITASYGNFKKKVPSDAAFSLHVMSDVALIDPGVDLFLDEEILAGQVAVVEWSTHMLTVTIQPIKPGNYSLRLRTDGHHSFVLITVENLSKKEPLLEGDSTWLVSQPGQILLNSLTCSERVTPIRITGPTVCDVKVTEFSSDLYAITALFHAPGEYELEAHLQNSETGETRKTAFKLAVVEDATAVLKNVVSWQPSDQEGQVSVKCTENAKEYFNSFLMGPAAQLTTRLTRVDGDNRIITSSGVSFKDCCMTFTPKEEGLHLVEVLFELGSCPSMPIAEIPIRVTSSGDTNQNIPEVNCVFPSFLPLLKFHLSNDLPECRVDSEKDIVRTPSIEESEKASKVDVSLGEGDKASNTEVAKEAIVYCNFYCYRQANELFILQHNKLICHELTILEIIFPPPGFGNVRLDIRGPSKCHYATSWCGECLLKIAMYVQCAGDYSIQLFDNGEKIDHQDITLSFLENLFGHKLLGDALTIYKQNILKIKPCVRISNARDTLRFVSVEASKLEVKITSPSKEETFSREFELSRNGTIKLAYSPLELGVYTFEPILLQEGSHTALEPMFFYSKEIVYYPLQEGAKFFVKVSKKKVREIKLVGIPSSNCVSVEQTSIIPVDYMPIIEFSAPIQNREEYRIEVETVSGEQDKPLTYYISSLLKDKLEDGSSQASNEVELQSPDESHTSEVPDVLPDTKRDMPSSEPDYHYDSKGNMGTKKVWGLDPKMTKFLKVGSQHLIVVEISEREQSLESCSEQPDNRKQSPIIGSLTDSLGSETEISFEKIARSAYVATVTFLREGQHKISLSRGDCPIPLDCQILNIPAPTDMRVEVLNDNQTYYARQMNYMILCGNFDDDLVSEFESHDKNTTHVKIIKAFGRYFKLCFFVPVVGNYELVLRSKYGSFAQRIRICVEEKEQGSHDPPCNLLPATVGAQSTFSFVPSLFLPTLDSKVQVPKELYPFTQCYLLGIDDNEQICEKEERNDGVEVRLNCHEQGIYAIKPVLRSNGKEIPCTPFFFLAKQPKVTPENISSWHIYSILRYYILSVLDQWYLVILLIVFAYIVRRIFSNREQD